MQITLLGTDKAYKYLGIWLAADGEAAHHLEVMREKFCKRRTLIMEAAFSFSWKIKLMNAVANKSVAYVAMTELNWQKWATALDVETRLILQKEWLKSHDGQPSNLFDDYIELPVRKGGWGWVTLTDDCNTIALETFQRFSKRNASESLLEQFIEQENWIMNSNLSKTAQRVAKARGFKMIVQVEPQYHIIEPKDGDAQRIILLFIRMGLFRKRENRKTMTTSALYATNQNPRKGAKQPKRVRKTSENLHTQHQEPSTIWRMDSLLCWTASSTENTEN